MARDGTVEHRSCVSKDALTLLADIFHGRDELLFQVLAVLGDLLALFKKVLGRLLHGHRQNMSLLGATLFLTGWAFVTGVHQCGHLRTRVTDE